MKEGLMAGLLLLLAVTAQADDEQTLRHFKTVLWQQAYRTQDTELLDRMLHEDFVVIDDSGNVSSKAEEIAWISENAWDPGEFEYRIERLDIYDSRYAIIAGTGVAERYSYKSSNVLIKIDGQWQAISSHVSGVESTADDTPDLQHAGEGAFHAVSVLDLDASIAWYTKHLGFTVDSRGENDVRAGALLSKPGSLLELAEFSGVVEFGALNQDLESHQVAGVFKLGFVVEDIEVAFADLQASGAPILFGIVTASDGRKTFGVTDPDGNIVQYFDSLQ